MRILLISLVIVIAGCAAPFTERQSPLQSMTPVNWKDWSSDISVSEMTWSDFEDETLKNLIREALAQNLTLEQSRMTLLTTQMRHAVTEGTVYPRVNFGLSGSGSGNFKEGDSFESYSSSLGASYEVDLWGKRANQIELSKLGLDGQEINLQTSRITIASNITQTYFRIRALDRQLELKTETRQSQKKQRDMMAARVKAGLAVTNDLDRQDVLLADLDSQIEGLVSDRSQAESQLAVLLGKVPQGFKLEKIDFEMIAPPPTRIGEPMEVLRHRPDIKQAELSLARAHISAEQVRISIFPSLSLSVTASTGSDKLTNLFDVITTPWSVSSSFNYPIFDGGARETDLALADLSLDQEVVSYKSAILNALLDMESVLASQASLKRQQESAARQAEIQRRVSEVTKANFNAGRMSSLDLIREEENLIAIEEREINLWLSAINNSVNMLRALGVDPASSL